MNPRLGNLLAGMGIASSLVCSACSQPSGRSTSAGKENSVSQSENTGSAVNEKGATAGERRVRVEKQWKGQSAPGEVIVRADEQPGQPGKEPETLAGSRAWLALGRTFLASGDAESAIECARQGLEALGDDYASPAVDDDTDMKLFAAEDRIAEGHVQDGAEVMLRILDVRTRLFAERAGLRLPD